MVSIVYVVLVQGAQAQQPTNFESLPIKFESLPTNLKVKDDSFSIKNIFNNFIWNF